MDSMQYAAALDLSEMGPEIFGVFGPLRGVVQSARRFGRPDVTGRYTRVWLKNGYGVLVLERHDANGEWDGKLSVAPIRHGGPDMRETTWFPVGDKFDRLAEGAPLYSVAAVNVTVGVDLLRSMSVLPGHSMRNVT